MYIMSNSAAVPDPAPVPSVVRGSKSSLISEIKVVISYANNPIPLYNRRIEGILGIFGAFGSQILRCPTIEVLAKLTRLYLSKRLGYPFSPLECVEQGKWSLS